MSDDERRGDRPDVLPGGRADTALGAGAALADLVGTLAGPVLAAAGTVLQLGLRMSRIGVGERVLAGLADRGGQVRAELEHAMRATVRRLVLAVVDVVDLTELVRRNVDLDALARGIDVDAIVARADLDAAVSRADLDAAVARVNLDAILDRIDVDAIVAKVDLDLVTSRIDLDAIAERLDADAVVGRVDLDAVVARLDLAGIAREVIDAIDLPEIIRQSSRALSSETVHGLRAEGMHADDAVARFVGRVLRRPDPERPALQ
ncbi:hypothetical protein FHX44_11956 [Pseudonocardia hierapolitana]|uniref:Uncharacterized protein n=1 Tax=Pseudonocardia hierapolitana TaxID=1128676 RepID=A0A561SJT0_9PSEU|nr:hypothetical protein [Pseudonocardia hierapolitana]TWF75072.1 hypothetical protein FHX44_11956 [Pseudonocardia hierapolitana]